MQETRMPTFDYGQTEGNDHPVALSIDEKFRIRRAMGRVNKVFPGAVGDQLWMDLNSYLEFGYRFANGSHIHRLVDQINEEVWEA